MALLSHDLIIDAWGGEGGSRTTDGSPSQWMVLYGIAWPQEQEVDDRWTSQLSIER